MNHTVVHRDSAFPSLPHEFEAKSTDESDANETQRLKTVGISSEPRPFDQVPPS